MKRIKKDLWSATKKIYKHTLLKSAGEQRIGFIVGCQRSGTTMLNNTFDNDLRTKVYGEGGLAKGYGRGTPFRLKSYEEVAQIFSQEKAPLLIAKPLVESQNILQLLDYFPNSKAIWIYRNFRDVASSSLKKFGKNPTHYNLRAVIDPELSDHWYAERVSDTTREIVKAYFTEDRPIHDLKALGWYVRNVLFFELRLADNPRVFLYNYEALVTEPDKWMRHIYQFLEFDYPGDKIVAHIHSASVKKGRHVELSSDIQALCDELLEKLHAVYDSQQQSAAYTSL
ncbi:MAG: sulfotransferase [Anaerolineae bacterium]|nr:sulfotransferase [Anaerolineae bacterium]